MRPASRSRLPKILWYTCLCASVWFVARASQPDSQHSTATVSGTAVSCPTEAAVASDQPACGRLCGQVARRSACCQTEGSCCESDKVVTCCDAEHPLAGETADCCETADSKTPEAVLKLIERLAPEALTMPQWHGEPGLGDTMVGQIGESNAEACDREAMLNCLRQLDTDHHVRAAAAACEVACDEDGGCYETRVCTDPLMAGVSVYAAPCSANTSSCRTARCTPAHRVAAGCAASNCAAPACGTTVSSAPACAPTACAPAGTSYAYCAPGTAAPVYYPACPPMYAPNPLLPPGNKRQSLQSSSMQLESIAQGLESAEMYEESDRVRQLAQELRMAARVARRPEPTISVPLHVSPGGEHVAPPAEAAPTGDSAQLVHPASATAPCASACEAACLRPCDQACPGSGASAGSEACTGHAGAPCSHLRCEASSAPCNAPCTKGCPTEFGVFADTDADGHPVFRRVE
jgi:hypothetical protein